MAGSDARCETAETGEAAGRRPCRPKLEYDEAGAGKS
jgi:hypothetical protein